MSQPANYTIEAESPQFILIRDVGPWDSHLTVTNDAERVVEEMVPRLNGRRLLYIDSHGFKAELLIKNGKFYCFGPAN